MTLCGLHKPRESLTLVIFLRNRLKHALTKKEVQSILMQRLVKVDGKVRTDTTYPSGFMDVISIDTKSRNCTLRYPDSLVKANDTVKLDLETGKMADFIKFDIGDVAIITCGRNMDCVRVITHREKHHGGFDIVHVKDALDH
ncbi:hypothetical protein K493DRAFT_307191 [Basidiobolus meristosporus CBS 931.73]|uniref:RNA-binding S4 domain-containing protein n=1 Tax=Basidiobolus meristosporus CBS 931.73 TaxID=1314790 RepID=A0A1Y1XJ10_9FUNG|nr:hypothetical protein K493DRAFT_307191 [Basidiobolus meristosporus CBS 931.73]|eukprot:ORX85750.1 hypothetical protein K493DRAFT_307191 [Basidiobolus meristosporus CBS 931.73]